MRQHQLDNLQEEDIVESTRRGLSLRRKKNIPLKPKGKKEEFGLKQKCGDGEEEN